MDNSASDIESMNSVNFTHIGEDGKVKMVDVTDKNQTCRVARAAGSIILNEEIIEKIKNRTVIKGDVLSAARIAGINAAKKTWELIPLCHQIKLTSIDIRIQIIENENKISSEAAVKGYDRTGVEMEALTAVAVSLLTIYDMCKALSKEMIIGEIELLEKSGGKSDFKRKNCEGRNS